MRHHLTFLAFSIILFGCGSNRYLLTDKDSGKFFLKNRINEENKKGSITNKPLLVLDGIPYRFDKELKKKRLPLAKDDINRIDVLKKEAGIQIYGDPGKSGVILITRTTKTEVKNKPFDDSVVLIFLNDKQISREELNALDPKDIESIDVIKDKEKIKAFTQETVDGVLVIHTKQKK